MFPDYPGLPRHVQRHTLPSWMSVDVYRQRAWKVWDNAYRDMSEGIMGFRPRPGGLHGIPEEEGRPRPTLQQDEAGPHRAPTSEMSRHRPSSARHRCDIRADVGHADA
jgi:hypothetical protein